MIYEDTLKGRYVDLISCTEEDAAFTLSLRKDPVISRFLPGIDSTVAKQKDWIRGQRQREGDYFFVVWDKQGNRIGTISIYQVQGDHAEGGRLAIQGNALQAIEAQMLSFWFAFHILGLNRVDGFIYADNERAIRFNKQFAGRHNEPYADENGRTVIRIENWKEDFERAEQKLRAILYREKEKRGMTKMTNLEKYNNAFVETFEITLNQQR